MHDSYSSLGSFIGTMIAYSFLWSLAAWLACACFAGYLAGTKGRSGFIWFFWGLIFGPVGLVASVGLPPVVQRVDHERDGAQRVDPMDAGRRF